MRLFLTSTIIAFVLLLPKLAALYGHTLPADWVLGIPAAGLGYMLVFFHEIGHTAAYFIFGEPAFPRFDFEHGGGYAQSGGRSWLILAMIWALMAMTAGYLYRHMLYRWLIVFCIFIVLHTALLFTEGHQVIISFMGHGAEILVCAFCMLCAFWNAAGGRDGTHHRAVIERWLCMIFGVFGMLYIMIFMASLIFSPAYRNDYAHQKGGHLLGDLDRVADQLGIGFPFIAGFLLLLTIVLFGVTVWQGLAHAPLPDHHDDIDKPQSRRLR